MRALTAAVWLAILTLVVAAQSTGYDYDKTADFSAYKTYAMKPGTEVGDKLIDDRIVAAIDSQLGAKGLKRSETPDLAVTYHVAIDKQKDISAWSTGAGPYGWRWGGGWGTTDVQVRDVLIGTLIIDMADLKTNEVVWRGIGTKELDTRAKPERRDRNVQKAVEKILKDYPPKKR